MAKPQVLEGTWEELAVHAQEFNGKLLRLTVLSDEKPKTKAPEQKPASRAKKERVSALGKYAGVLSTEAFLRDKQEEIELEERKFRR